MVDIFDTTSLVTLRGTLASVEWKNPHVILHLDTRSNAGKDEKWSVETLNAQGLSQRGLNADSFKVGETRSMIVCVKRDGATGRRDTLDCRAQRRHRGPCGLLRSRRFQPRPLQDRLLAASGFRTLSISAAVAAWSSSLEDARSNPLATIGTIADAVAERLGQVAVMFTTHTPLGQS